MTTRMMKPKSTTDAFCAFPEVEAYASIGTEHAHQVALFMWIALVRQFLDKAWFTVGTMTFYFKPHMIESLHLLFAIPNGGERNQAVASRLKAEGVKSGVPDLFLPVPTRLSHGLFIEMKRPASPGKRAGTVQKNQMKFIQELTAQNYLCSVCYSYIEAIQAIYWYFKTEGPL